ncbi:MAG: hypothetical protein B7Y05_08755 [Polynucleobacter sp. 24-46-87]|jgi:hypothetical protein|uniref:hypothetical protein n=1 Tax=Polynucleobacter sp. MWH-Jannik1A5 TaxID=1855890 RepID=UPI000BD6D84D|nr:hypothetical protein [Polynucleobacter sp. MWH-Jannik1A5]OYY58895.1 MAG: hypothetical protein B7Y55_01530 [Polynucleobacter sp. 35-46-207]OYZ37895.1 MAG: hypothetical protein B7Y22_02725 [Polynucleobacter sp. 16-46-70]OZA13853.1 MAG: hypothetical protein B7Y05_08755 [Polynucleobacter sp. 24-46-87]OZA41164.1 MAG: hypothetical protein B7X83_02980 [Polynucleobacter sp. 17-46-58]OZB48817.1 MAG: hypothetical protein B7X60_03050 [Polynucleobacter sp. 39-45-136]HQR84292.1 hypothetical protein [Po
MSKWIISVLLLIELGLVTFALFYLGFCHPDAAPVALKNILLSILFGGLGGTIYCLRGVYLNACVRKKWDSDWAPWYLIRPFLSLALGGISYLLIKSGLLFLNANQGELHQLGIWLLAFLAGLNVDKTLSKIESIGQSVWGIEPSKQSEKHEGKNG